MAVGQQRSAVGMHSISTKMRKEMVPLSRANERVVGKVDP